VKGIQVHSNQGPSSLQRGDNHKNVKIWWGHLQIFYRITRPILARLGSNHRWGRGFKFVQMKSITPLQGEEIAKE
jgi:hypothetical protein